MSEQKKFGAFAGVFTPSLLTILGVIMYMRLGWAVGNSGLIGVIIVITIAHVISITTGLSISSIATDKKVGAGGVYYVLSRSLGLPIGGAIGVTLFVGTAMSIALYLIGFAESFNACLGLDTGINGLRMGGSLALLVLTILAIISTSLALKAQFFILAAIIVSLFSIFFGTSPAPPESLPMFAQEGTVSMEMVFAIFFPAVTGFTAGIAMSGDLKDPKKSIPSGTLWSIAVGFVVYIGLASFIFFTVDSEVLKTDNNILLKVSLFAPAVFAGIWGATLSSALGGILGGPRILQAMSVDKITPKFFAKGVGKSNEPRNALLLTVLIAQGGILIGELDTIARICSMFYLAAYGFINLSFFLESWASTDFNPTFKVKRWIGFVGFISTFVVMFRLDMVAMVGAFLVIGGIYLWLTRKELALGSGDVWQSVWSSVVKTGLRRMDEKQDHKRNWKPNVLLFSGGTTHRPYLLEFSKELVGNRGIVTNFDLHENKEATVLFPKHKQSVSDEVLKKYGVFGRQIEVKNVFKGIESIASTFGFSGIEPNTILMGWAKNTKDPIWFAQMTQKLIDLDYNVLYLDYDERFGYRKYSTIDLWWRGVGNNAELMLNIAKFLHSSDLWRNAQIRIIMVENANSNKKIIEKKISNVLETHRISASIKIIGNALEKKPIYELMKIYSADTDLIILGIPQVRPEKVQDFVSKTNDLVSTIGTTLLVKASSRFDDVDVITSDVENQIAVTTGSYVHENLPGLIPSTASLLNIEITKFEESFRHSTHQFVENAITPIQEKYIGLYQLILTELEQSGNFIGSDKDVYQHFLILLQHFNKKLQYIRQEDLSVIGALFSEENIAYLDTINGLIKSTPAQLKLQINGSPVNVKFNKAAQLLKKYSLFPSLRSTYIQLGKNTYENLIKTDDELLAKIYSLCEGEGFYQHNLELDSDILSVTAELIPLIKQQLAFFQNLGKKIEFELLSAGRYFCNELSEISGQSDFKSQFRKIKKQLNRKENKNDYEDLLSFPNQWAENQQYLHTTLETNLELAQANLLIIKGLGKISYSLDQKVNKRIEKQFTTNSKTIHSLVETFKTNGAIDAIEEFSVDENAFENIETLLQNLKTETALIPQIIRDDAVLMSKALMEDFETLQLEGILPIILDLPKIVDFILESKLNGPVQNLLERYLSQISGTYFNQINRVNLLKYSLTESREQEENAQLLEKVLPKFESDNDFFENTKLRFQEDIRLIEYDLQMELDTRYLAEHADNWSRYISVSKRKKGFAKFNEQVKTKFSDLYQGVNSSYSAKKHESDVSVFESKYNLKSNVELGLNFTNGMYPTKSVLENLPFYYKQLFQGKHLPVQSKYIGRDRELSLIDEAIAQKRNGAILIAGKSASGKTHFSQYIANNKFKGKVFNIDSLGKQGTIKVLNHTFATATGKSGNVEQCLYNIAPHSIIIINDIEVWWNRNLEKDALSILIKMLSKFHKKHTFILNVNLHAMQALSKHRAAKKMITKTIVLPLVSKDAMRVIILERHRVGGLDLSFRGDDNKLEGKYFNQLINKIHSESEGNIGLGLQIWLRQIESFTENKIYLAEHPKLETLKVSEPYWKLLLYQFLINKNLTRTKISALFGEDETELAPFLLELLKSGMLDEVGKNTYTLNSIVKPNVEKWLVDNNIL
ncbi:MAG: solute carrier family 12 sodium/potassium/chloride transporter 2 [Salibacteraceae bacterium]|jgi:solute carrier family 12 sodium/potassium/chloride transporter 2